MTQSSSLGEVTTGTGSVVRGKFNTGATAVVTTNEGTSAPSPTYAFMDWRNNTAKLLRERNAGNSAWLIQKNYGATSDPSATTDETDGYAFGTEYYNTTGKRIFTCVDPTDNAAVWQNVIGVNEKNFVNVKKFGAKGDGSTDDTAACRAALAEAANGILYFPPGVYILNNNLVLENAAITIIGAGEAITELRWVTSSNGIYLTSNNSKHFHKVANLTLSTYISAGTAIFLNYSGQIVDLGGGALTTMNRLNSRFLIENVNICGTGIIDNGVVSNGWINGIFSQAAIYGSVRSTTIIGGSLSGTAGVVFAGNPVSGSFNNGRPVAITLTDCNISNIDIGYYIINAEGIFIKNSKIHTCNKGIYILSEANGHPHFTCNGNTISAADRCIYVNGEHELFINRNSLSITGSGTVAIELGTTAISAIITKNIITCKGTGQYGGVIRAQKGVITNNIIIGVIIYGFWLTIESAGWKVNNNVYAIAIQNVLDQGTGNSVT